MLVFSLYINTQYVLYTLHKIKNQSVNQSIRIKDPHTKQIFNF